MRKTIFLSAIILISALSFAQTLLSVDAAGIVNDVGIRPIGINTDYLMDDDTNLRPSISTQVALKGMGVKYLRYPGGEKSDNYLWSISPWSTPAPHFARTGTDDWPSNDSRFAMSNRSTCKSTVLDFDEFMQICVYAGAEPVIVVCFDAMYKPASSGGTAPTRQQLKDHATQWVRYANITRKYGIKYWEIGNESYHPGSYNGIAPSATVYAQDLAEFSKAMKAVDPTIKIGANGNAGWWATLLQTARNEIDFLSAHTYPTYNYTGYDQYRNAAPVFTSEVNSAIAAINTYGPGSGKFVALTEYNAIYYGSATGWSNQNDLGHALAVFDMAGQHLQKPEVKFSLLWNTRWVNNQTKSFDITDALDKNGNLNPNGRALAVWNSFLLKNMVSLSGATTQVRGWASVSAGRDSLSVFLINKNYSAQTVSVSVVNYPGSASGKRWEFSGAGPNDTVPVWAQKIAVALTSGNVSLSLPPVSITVLSFSAGLPGIIKPAFLKPSPPVTPLWRWFDLQGRHAGGHLTDKDFFQKNMGYSSGIFFGVTDRSNPSRPFIRLAR